MLQIPVDWSVTRERDARGADRSKRDTRSLSRHKPFIDRSLLFRKPLTLLPVPAVHLFSQSSCIESDAERLPSEFPHHSSIPLVNSPVISDAERRG